MHVRIGLHGAVAGLVVHPGDNIPIGMRRGVKGGGAWLVLSAVPHVVVHVVTAFGPATIWIRSHEWGIGGTGHQTSSPQKQQRRDLHRFIKLTPQARLPVQQDFWQFTRVCESLCVVASSSRNPAEQI